MEGVPWIIVVSSLFSLFGMDLLNLKPSSAGVKTENTEFLLLAKYQLIGYNVINIYVYVEIYAYEIKIEYSSLQTNYPCQSHVYPSKSLTSSSTCSDTAITYRHKP